MSNSRPFPHGRGLLAVVLAFPLVACAGARGPEGPKHADQPVLAGKQIEIPRSMKIEHEEIHGALIDATRAPGRTGEAARELAKILHPHFVREEEIALPPLGLLEPLAKGEYGPEMLGVLSMTDALRAELPAMLRQHEAIAAAARRLEQAAKEEGNQEAERMAKQLQLHAETEEQLFYPAAILVGEVVRARAARK